LAEGGVALPPVVLDRARMRAEIEADPDFDVVVIGGGITGAGTFRDLALQGLRVLLVERADFASGASGALTRIAHGGFRYLERGEIALVRDSVIERDRLVANAPHAVRPISVVLPLSSWFAGLLGAPLRFLKLDKRKGGLPGIVPMAIGRRLYDALAGKAHALPAGRILTGRGLAARFPYLAGRWTGALELGEARILMPERVAIELIEDGVAAGSRSAALNYCAVTGVEDGRIVLHDALDGVTRAVHAEVMVNAAGAHADSVAALFGVQDKMTGGVAGVHLVLDAPRLAAALGDDLLFFEDANPDPAKRRLNIGYRLAENRVLLGTTESDCPDPDAARLTDEDVRYLKGALAAALPGLGVAEAPVVGHLVGVRPLVRSNAESLASRSRDHAVFVHRTPLPLVTIIGGKWTTFRRMAEDAADSVLDILGRARRVSTRDLAIGGGAGYPRSAAEREAIVDGLAQSAGIGLDRAAELFDRYGTRARGIAAWVRAYAGESEMAGTRLSAGEIAFFRAAEMAVSDADVIKRRSDAWQTLPASDADARQ